MKQTVSDILNCLANLSSDEVFTSPELANRMLDMLPQDIFIDPNAKFLAPCSKSGVFLREIAKRLLVGLEGQIPDLQQRIDHIMGKQLFGIALTQLTAEMSRRTLYCAKKANGEYSVAQCFGKNEQGNLRYMRCEHIWANGKCSQCGANRAQYDRLETIENYAYPFIHKNINEIFKNMQFDVIIGNPPYQMSDGGGMQTKSSSGSSMPLYHRFIEQAKKLNPKYLSMIIPARWFSGGRGLDEFRNTMLNDNRLAILVDYSDSRDCFPGVDIAGGVCYFLWARDKKSPTCLTINNCNGNSESLERKLNDYSVFVRSIPSLQIIRKVQKCKENTLESVVYSSNPFGYRSFEEGVKQPEKGMVELFGSKGVTYVQKEDVSLNSDLIHLWKVVMSKTSAEHAGQADKDGRKKIISRMMVLKPNQICSESYLLLDVFDNEMSAVNMMGYMKTTFSRFLLSVVILTQNIARSSFQFLPLQDFSHPWADEMLYEKYGLSEDEINFIESMIKPME